MNGWAVPADGGYLGHPQLSKYVYEQAQQIMRWVQFADVDSDFGRNKGDTLLFNKHFDVLAAGGQLTEGVPIPATKSPFTQGSCIAYEWGNSISHPEVLSHFAEIDPLDKFQLALTNDMAKTRDRMVKAQFELTKVVYTPTGTDSSPTATWSFTGTAGAVASRNLQLWDLRELNEAMRSGYYGSTYIRPVPPFDEEGNYCFVGAVGALRQIRQDDDWKNLAYHADPERLLVAEAGRVENFRCIEENHLLSRTLGTSTFKGEAYAFGADTVKLISVVPPELRQKVAGDYGRDRGVAWYSVEGASIIWSYQSGVEEDNRIIRIGSL